MKSIFENLHGRHEQFIYWSTVLMQSTAPSYFGSYVVLGHPSAGTNWLCNMLSDYNNIPVLESWNRNVPSVERSIFHLHRFMAGGLPQGRTIYMYRDGRDTLVSLFMKIAKTPNMARWRERFRKETGLIMDAEKIIEQLPVYIEWHFTKKQPASINWRDHIDRSLHYGYKSISFEELKRSPSDGLKKVLLSLECLQIDVDRVNASVVKNDIVNKRNEDNSYQVRNGRTGEWCKYFTKEAADCFQHHAGDQLVALGYEIDSSWTNKF